MWLQFPEQLKFRVLVALVWPGCFVWGDWYTPDPNAGVWKKPPGQNLGPLGGRGSQDGTQAWGIQGQCPPHICLSPLGCWGVGEEAQLLDQLGGCSQPHRKDGMSKFKSLFGDWKPAEGDGSVLSVGVNSPGDKFPEWFSVIWPSFS